MSTQELDKLAALDDVPVAGGADDYEPPSDNARPIEPGTYTFMRVNEQDSDFKQGRSVARDGQAMAWFQFKLAIQGGPFDGRFVFDGCNTYIGKFRPSPSAADFLRASKSSARPTTIKTYEEAVAKTYGPFNAVTDWEWRCRDCQETFLTGAKKPRKPKKYEGKLTTIKRTNGEVSHEQTCPGCGQTVGAQARIARYVVPKQQPVTISSNATSLPPAEG